MNQIHIVPLISELERFFHLAQEYNAKFEYNDFFKPDILDNEREMIKLIDRYKALPRDRSEDTLHGAFYDVTVFSSDRKIREISEHRVRQSLTIAKELGVKGVVFHTNYIANFILESYRNEWLDKNEIFFRKMFEEYSQIDIYMENMFDNDPYLLAKLGERFNDIPRFGICFDYAHAAISATPHAEWVNVLNPYIRHIHINDNDLFSDLHSVVGQGKIVWSEYNDLLLMYNLEPSVLVEVKGAEATRKSLEYMKENQLYPMGRKKSQSDFVFRRGEGQRMDNLNISVNKILDIGIALTTEKNYNKLLELILHEAMEITNSDAGTLYLSEENSLRFIIMQNNTMNTYQGGNGEDVNLPQVPLKDENVCAYAALNKKVVNIEDVYHCMEFDFSGPRNYDAITGYHTESMLVIPLENHEGEVLGVIQLINAQDKEHKIISYAKEYEYIVYSLASQASVSLANMLFIKETKELLYSTVSVMAAAIDERTPYNANHTYNVAKYTEDFVGFLNEEYKNGTYTEYFDDNRKEQLVMAAMLHDIGKLVIPLEIMNKFSRLCGKLDSMLAHLELIGAYLKIDYLEQRITKKEWEEETEYLKESAKLITMVDTAAYLTEDMLGQIHVLGSKVYRKADGGQISYITGSELDDLLIAKGTLTAREREIMESHVQITSKLLTKIHFNKNYANVARWAGGHHEYLDGSGYPNHLKADDIPADMRILVTVDIFEAMISSDRPYKKAVPLEKALFILHEMAEEGKLDKTLVNHFQNYIESLERV